MSGSAPAKAPAPVAIPDAVLLEVYAHARTAFPAECCGWLVGPKGAATVTRARRAENAYQPDAHPTAGDRSAETAYVIAGTDLLELSRSLDGDEPALVIYHSHPNGRAYFSDTDKKVATDPWGDGPMLPVQQLVVGIDANRVVEAAQFAWDDAARDFVEIARWRVST
jgi:proteasome lid subunit RPN8/RPN11